MSRSHTCARARVRLRAPFGALLTPEEILTAPPSYDEATLDSLRAMGDYLTRFLTAPHPRLGRPGAVCPFAARALGQQAIHLTAFMDAAGAEDAIMEGMEQLRTLMVSEGGGGNRAVVAVFPRLKEPEGARMIERIQASMKLSFVKSGLMLGEFYPSCTRGGLWNDDFKALQAPAISLAVRNITLYDAPFMLDRQAYADAFAGIFGEVGQERILKARHALAARRGPSQEKV